MHYTNGYIDGQKVCCFCLPVCLYDSVKFIRAEPSKTSPPIVETAIFLRIREGPPAGSWPSTTGFRSSEFGASITGETDVKSRNECLLYAGSSTLCPFLFTEVSIPTKFLPVLSQSVCFLMSNAGALNSVLGNSMCRDHVLDIVVAADVICQKFRTCSLIHRYPWSMRARLMSNLRQQTCGIRQWPRSFRSPFLL